MKELLSEGDSASVCVPRIVKMSSPNLNVLTLLGSVLTYTSGFLFAPGEGASAALLQVNALLPAALLRWILGSSD